MVGVIFKNLFFLCLFFLFSSFYFSPTNRKEGKKLHTKSKKLEKLFYKAQYSYETKNDSEAINILKKIILKDSNFIESYLLLGYLYLDKFKLFLAINQFRKVIKIDSSFYPPIYLRLSEIELYKGEYKLALKHSITYLSIKKITPVNRAKAQRVLKNSQFALKQIEDSLDIKFENLGPNVNTSLNEYFPRLTADESKMIFTRRLIEKNSPVEFNEDFYVSQKINNQWQKSKNLTSINTKANEGASSISTDGKKLFYTICHSIFFKWGKAKEGYGSCDLFSVNSVGGKWVGQPKNLGPMINSKQWESQPSFSSDGKTLFFVKSSNSKRRGYSNQDIYFSELSDSGWSEPIRLSDQVNTPFNETSVFIHPDKKTLYFCSDGYVGMGGTDIYMTKRIGFNEWTKPINLGYPINSYRDEMSFIVNTKGTKGYISSEKKGGLGGLDIYRFSLPKKFRPNFVTYLKGKVVDESNHHPIGANFELINLKTKEIVMISKSDNFDGSYLVCLPVNQEYALNVNKEGYIFYSENFSLKNYSQTQPYILDISLQPIKKGYEIELKNIFFETNKYELLPKSIVELDKLVSFLKNNADVHISLEGHTDNVGKDFDNQILSEKRVQSVFNYLISKNIDNKKLKTKGWGASKPIADNKTQKGRAKNRRIVLRIVD